MGSCRCHGVTINKKRCKLKKKGTLFCKIHEYQKEIEKNEDCSVCLNVIRDPLALECQHNFCTDCINRWVCTNTSCPMCRTPIHSSTIIFNALSYGLKNKLCVRMNEYTVKISTLNGEELEHLNTHNIRPYIFMHEAEWNQIKELIFQDILDKLHITLNTVIMRTTDEQQYTYFNQFNTIYLFN